MDLQLDGAALTAWLVDTPSVSGDDGPLADAIEAALRLLPHLTVHRDGNTIVARTTLGRPERVIVAGCQGTLRAELVVPGQRAHTARSWMDRNAIHEAGAVLDVLRGYTPREPEVDGLRYHEGLNAVGIRGGVAGNVVPDECVVTVNFRFAPDRSAEQAADFVRSLFPAWPVTALDVADGARPGLGQPAAAEFAAAVGGTPRPKLGATDVPRLAAPGIPAANHGPGFSELAHTPGEAAHISTVAECEGPLAAGPHGS